MWSDGFKVGTVFLARSSNDGRILCVCGHRFPSYGIRAVHSENGGRTWNGNHPLIVRDDLPSRDLDYPAAVLTPEGHVYTVYYGQDSDGVTCIQATRFALD
ncbi:MAG: hypothetical protein IPK19_11165 [Chloroflexi bacterium]|nr:hypothetical protein [Chloroflexota bacterium]